MARQLAVYVHWPFCTSKCPYCDFNTYVRHGGIDERRYADALCQELKWFGGQLGRRHVSSVFFGGGTPSLVSPQSIATILQTVDRVWGLETGAEITIEANPTSAEASRFSGYSAAGVNRISVGVQALNDADLRLLGRRHTVSEALAAFRLATRVFARTSFDLIYARPGQTVHGWRDELIRALAEQHGHMSLYQLTIEPHTPFAELQRAGRLKTPGEDLAADLFELTQELTAAAGLGSYEISNHAEPGHMCRHNMAYWRYADYVGVGPGAHSRIVDSNGRRRAIVAEKKPETWLAEVETAGAGISVDDLISREDAAAEYLIMGLRLDEGIRIGEMERLAGRPVDIASLAGLIEDGLVQTDQSQAVLHTTMRGKLVLNTLIAEIQARALG